MVDRYDVLDDALSNAIVGEFSLQVSDALQYYIRDLECRLLEMGIRITTLEERLARQAKD